MVYYSIHPQAQGGAGNRKTEDYPLSGSVSSLSCSWPLPWPSFWLLPWLFQSKRRGCRCSRLFQSEQIKVHVRAQQCNWTFGSSPVVVLRPYELQAIAPRVEVDRDARHSDIGRQVAEGGIGARLHGVGKVATPVEASGVLLGPERIVHHLLRCCDSSNSQPHKP